MTVRLSRLLLVLLALVAVAVSACSGPEPEYGFDGVCTRSGRPIESEMSNRSFSGTIQWTPDGTQILFDYWAVYPRTYRRQEASDIYAVNVSGNQVRLIKDLPSRSLGTGAQVDATVFDLSADGIRMAYAACGLRKDSKEGTDSNRQVYNYEIFLSRFGGVYVERLTNNTYFDSFPAWSPDGESLAFISDPDRSIPSGGRGTGRGYIATTRITVHRVATGESREIGLPESYAVAPIRLEWSPSGDRIAFVALEGERHPWNLAVYIVGADGTGLTRVSDALSGPTWSPDGQFIAMVVPEGGDEEALYIFATDGSNVVKEKYRLDTRGVENIETELGPGRWYGNLSWSPDGSRMLFELTGGFVPPGPAVVPLGAGRVEAGVPGSTHASSRAMTAGAGAGSIFASPLNDWIYTYQNSAWSPDGAQIAVRSDTEGAFVLEVVDLEGNSRFVLELHREPKWR